MTPEPLPDPCAPTGDDSAWPLVCHVGTEMSWRGGEQQVEYLLQGIRRRGAARQVLVAQPGSEQAKRAREAGFEVLELASRGGMDFRAAHALGSLVKARGVSIVHAHTSHAHSLAWLGVARRGLAPVVVTRRVDFTVSKPGLAGIFKRAKYVHPNVHMIAISEGVRRVLAEGGVPRDRVKLVWSGVDFTRFDARAEEARAGAADFRRGLGIGEDCAVIGQLAALTDHKGQKYLVEAAARLRERQQAGKLVPRGADGRVLAGGFRVVIFGQGELRSTLQEQVRSLGLGAVVLLAGHTSAAGTALAAMDVFCMSSHLEGLGTSVVEAMGNGVCCVTTNAGGLADLVENEKSGLSVAARDAGALAEALARVLEDPALRGRLAAGGRERARAHFSADGMVDGTVRVYRDVLARATGQ